MNVLLVNPYRLDAGGLTTMVLRLREGLAARGHKALVLAAADTDGVTRLPGADTYGIYLRRVRQSGALTRPLAGFLLGLVPTLRSLSGFLERERIEVVHVHFPVPSALYFATLRRRAQWKLVTTFHGSDGHTLGERSRGYRTLLGRALARTDAVTAVSADLLSTVVRFYPDVVGRSRVVMNGNPIEPAGDRPPPPLPPGLPSPYALAVGNLMAVKGYDILARAVRLARDRGHDLQVVVVGEGPEAASLRPLVADLGNADRLHFIGEVPYEAMGPLYTGPSRSARLLGSRRATWQTPPLPTVPSPSIDTVG